MGKSAIVGHKKAGFKQIGFVDGNCILELTKNDYLNFVKWGQLVNKKRKLVNYAKFKENSEFYIDSDIYFAYSTK